MKVISYDSHSYDKEQFCQTNQNKKHSLEGLEGYNLYKKILVFLELVRSDMFSSRSCMCANSAVLADAFTKYIELATKDAQ